jgi:hypothetical protein
MGALGVLKAQQKDMQAASRKGYIDARRHAASAASVA